MKIVSEISQSKKAFRLFTVDDDLIFSGSMDGDDMPDIFEEILAIEDR
ncbi:unnamed protein product, partial [marine sediment metagenome]